MKGGVVCAPDRDREATSERVPTRGPQPPVVTPPHRGGVVAAVPDEPGVGESVHRSGLARHSMVFQTGPGPGASLHVGFQGRGDQGCGVGRQHRFPRVEGLAAVGRPAVAIGDLGHQPRRPKLAPVGEHDADLPVIPVPGIQLGEELVAAGFLEDEITGIKVGKGGAVSRERVPSARSRVVGEGQVFVELD